MSKLDFVGKFLSKPKFGPMEDRVPLDQLMTTPARHSIWMLGIRDYPIDQAVPCTW